MTRPSSSNRHRTVLRAAADPDVGVSQATHWIPRHLVALTLALAALAGCTLTDEKAQSLMVSPVNEKPRQFILLDAREYEGELAFALVERGFTVKPIAIRQGVTELEGSNRLVEYREAGFRYALKVSVVHEAEMKCVLSGSHRVSATISIIDIATNSTLAIIKQVGPDGRCPPLTPVWSLLAQELARVWK